MGTVALGGATHTIYGEFTTNAAPLLSATTYFASQLNATGWDAASGTDKQKALVTASRILDKQLWGGSPADVVTPQPLAWPRTGATDKDGTAIGAAVIPEDVIYASFELAAAILTTAALQTSGSDGSNTRRTLSVEKVGDLEVTAETEYFMPTITGPGALGRFPPVVQEYLKGLLSSGAIAATVTGSAASNFADDDFTLTDPGL